MIARWIDKYSQRRKIELRWLKDECREIVLEGIHKRAITCFHFYKGTLYTGSADGAVGHWDVNTGKYMRKFEDLNGYVVGIDVIQNVLVICTKPIDYYDARGSNLYFYDCVGGNLLKCMNFDGSIIRFRVIQGFIFFICNGLDESFLEVLDMAGKSVARVENVNLMPSASSSSRFTVMIDDTVLVHGFVMDGVVKVEREEVDVVVDEVFQTLFFSGDVLWVHSVFLSVNYLRPFDGSYDPILIDGPVLCADIYESEWVIVATTENLSFSTIVWQKQGNSFVEKWRWFEIGVTVVNVKIDSYKAILIKNDYSVSIHSLETGDCVAQKIGFIKMITSILINPEICFFGSSDSTSRVYNYSSKSSLRYKKLKYKELTPKDKITVKRNDKSILLVLMGALSPIHRMHVQILENIKIFMENSGYDVVGGYLSPSHDLYNKYGLLPAYDRIEMCELTVKTSIWIMVDKWEASQSDFQIQNAVLKHLQSIFKDVEIFYCCGLDSIPNIGHILQDFRVICHKRPEYEFPSTEFFKSALKSKRILLCTAESDNISSSLIRSKQSNSMDFSDMLDPGVSKYLEKNCLFDSI